MGRLEYGKMMTKKPIAAGRDKRKKKERKWERIRERTRGEESEERDGNQEALDTMIK